jgi:hypothetical protein
VEILHQSELNCTAEATPTRRKPRTRQSSTRRRDDRVTLTGVEGVRYEPVEPYVFKFIGEHAAEGCE